MTLFWRSNLPLFLLFFVLFSSFDIPELRVHGLPVENRSIKHDPSNPWQPTSPDHLHSSFTPPVFQWEELPFNFTISSSVDTVKPTYSGVQAESLLGGQRLYVVIATISRRIHRVADVINNILNGAAIPTHIYLMLSKEKFLLDEGVPQSKLPVYLKFLVYSGYLTIVYTENIGPHRKLLPILSRLWSQDDVIVTFDDDRRVPRDSLLRLIKYYLNSNRDAVVGLRVRRIGVCATYRTGGSGGSKASQVSPPRSHTTADAASNATVSRKLRERRHRRHRRKRSKPKTAHKDISELALPHQSQSHAAVSRAIPDVAKRHYRLGLAEYGACRWPRVQNRYIIKEMLALPTGNGGVLYRPRFFHPIVFDEQLRALTQWNDDLTFRLSTMVKGIFVVPGCCDDDFSYCQDLFTSMKDAVKRKSSLYDQNQARNSAMWMHAVKYLTNHSLEYTSPSSAPGKGNKKLLRSGARKQSDVGWHLRDAMKQYLPSERSSCGIDRDSPLKRKLSSKNGKGIDQHDSGSSFDLKNLVGVKDLQDKQRKALVKEGNKCGVHWCNSNEKNSNSDHNTWIIIN